jgi:L,D-transpeptidase ErfK/SrfK
MSTRARVPSLLLWLPIAAIAVATALAAPIGTGVTGELQRYEVMRGDTLGLVAARFGVETAVLARDNHLSASARLQPGDTLEIDNRHIIPEGYSDGIVVNLPQRRLFLFRDGQLQQSYPVAVGSRGWRTPRGEFTIQRMELDPSWEVPVSIQSEMAREGKRVLTRVAPGPDNPLGSRWIGLTDSIGIHGTNAPSSIFKFSTHGCIRMATEDVEHLFELVEEGDPVSIIYEPLLVAKDGRGVFVEVHRDPYGLGGASMAALNGALTDAGETALIGHPAIAGLLARPEGRAVALR